MTTAIQLVIDVKAIAADALLGMMHIHTAISQKKAEKVIMNVKTLIIITQLAGIWKLAADTVKDVLCGLYTMLIVMKKE